MTAFGAIHNPRNVKPQTHQTRDKHNQDTPNLIHIKPQTKNIGLSTTPQIKMPFFVIRLCFLCFQISLLLVVSRSIRFYQAISHHLDNNHIYNIGQIYFYITSRKYIKLRGKKFSYKKVKIQFIFKLQLGFQLKYGKLLLFVVQLVAYIHCLRFYVSQV